MKPVNLARAMRIAALGALVVLAPVGATAQSVQDQIISQLRAQGFTQMTVSRTWLGRIRVVAFRGDTRRELVFNPQTGEILRDFWRDDDDGPKLFDPDTWRDDDDDDDDRDDDDDDDDDRDDDDDEEDDDDERDDDDDERDDDRRDRDRDDD